jgi:hypothetical protein
VVSSIVSWGISIFLILVFIVLFILYKKLNKSDVSASKNDVFCKLLLNYNPLIISGTQGSGKTTLAMSFIVYYLKLNPEAKFFHCGLDGSALGESFTDFEHWQDLPENSLIYIDECDKHGFANSRYTDVPKLPAHLRALTELRHKGHHLLLSTVNAKDVHYHARNLCPGWVDLSRAFGLKFAQAELKPGWKEVKKLSKDELKKYNTESSKAKVYHDAEIQKLFKSSSIHTNAYQINVPWKKIFIFLGGIIFVFLLFNVLLSLMMPAPTKPASDPTKETAPGGFLSPTPPPALIKPESAPALIEPAAATAGPVKLFTDRERAQYSVPAFMSDLEFVTYFEGGGYRCGHAKLGKFERCWCDWIGDNVGKANVSSATCYSHVATRLYPHLSSATKVASNN